MFPEVPAPPFFSHSPPVSVHLIGRAIQFSFLWEVILEHCKYCKYSFWALPFLHKEALKGNILSQDTFDFQRAICNIYENTISSYDYIIF